MVELLMLNTFKSLKFCMGVINHVYRSENFYLMIDGGHGIKQKVTMTYLCPAFLSGGVVELIMCY